MKKQLSLIFSLLLFWIRAGLLSAQTISPNAAGILYVDRQVAVAGDGSSWENALTSFADALDYAQDKVETPEAVKEIWVAEGTYYPAYIPKRFGFSTIDRDKTFELVKDVKIYGGFRGTESRPDERDLPNHPTVLSGDLDGDGTLSDNDAIHVVYAYGEMGTALLDGFTITGGNADKNYLSSFNNKRQGGGIYLQEASPVLKNLTVVKNYAGNNGGGAYLYKNSSEITNVAFHENEAYQDGGGVFVWSCSTVFDRLTVMNNESGFNGGGLFIHYDKTAGSEKVVITNATISDNKTDTQGGGVRIADASPVFKNVSLLNNSCSSYGGGVTTGEGSPVFINVLIADNSAKYGGGMEVGGTSSIINSTISGNKATTWGGGIYNTSGSPVYRNSIIWGNTGPYPEIYNFRASRPEYRYTLIKNCRGSGTKWNTAYGNDGGNNLDADPLFTDLAGQDFSVLPYSPAVNAGNILLYTEKGGNIMTDTDLAGNPRVYQGTRGRIDMGAFEYQGNTDNQVATWGFTGPAAVWKMPGSDWNGVRDDQFWHGDLVNFTGAAASEIEIAVAGVRPSGMYVSGSKDIAFTGGPVTTDSTARTTTFTKGDATTGKLILGKTASGISPSSSAVLADFTGTLTLKNADNAFMEGIEIYSGTLKTTTPGQLGAGLKKLKFADRGTLLFTDDVEFNGGGNDLHSLSLTNASGAIKLESGKTLTIYDNIVPLGNGGVANIVSSAKLEDTLCFVTPDKNVTDEPRFFFSGNKTVQNNGGVIYNLEGVFEISNAAFRDNHADGKAANGGVLYASGGESNITHSFFEANSAAGSGGYGGNGGAISLQGRAEVNVTRSIFRENLGDTYGGAVFNNESLLHLTDVSFIKNGAAAGGAFMSQGGENTLTVTEGKTSLFSGNRGGDESNAVYLVSYIYVDNRSSDLTITTEIGALLDMRDAIGGEAGAVDYPGECAILINKEGPGIWRLGGENKFSSFGSDEKGYGKTLFHINEGTFYLYYEGEVENPAVNDTAAKVMKADLTIEGSNSAFRLGDGTHKAILNFGGGNSINLPDGTFEIKENTVLQVNPERLTAYGELSVSASAFRISADGNKPAFAIDLESWKEGEYTLVTANKELFGPMDFTEAVITVAGNPVSEKLSARLSAGENGTKLVLTATRLMTSEEITVAPIAPVTYTGSACTPEPEVRDGTEILVKDTDYSVSYSANINVGRVTVTITGIGRYSGERTVSFDIVKADPVMTWAASAGLTYGESLAQAVITGGTGEGVFAFRDEGLKPAVSDSQATDYVLLFIPADTTNYRQLEKNDMKVTVDRARLTVTGRPLNMNYGTDPAGFAIGDAYDIAGFVNGENEAVLTVKPRVKLASSITSASPAGTYPDAVEVAGATAANYDFGYVFNTLTIVQAPSGHITFDAIPAKVYGDAPFRLSGRHALGKTVTYESNSTVVTVENTGGSWQATIKGAGTVMLTAKFAGDDDVEAESVSQTMTIGKASLTITARDQERVFGEPNPDISSAYDCSSFIQAGDVNLFTVLPRAMIDPQYDAGTAAGTYPGGVLVSGGEHPYYDLIYVAGTLTIGPAAGAVYFTAVGNKTYGDADFNLTATHIGGNPVKYESLSPDVIRLYEENGITKGRILKVGTAVLRAYTIAENSYTAAEAKQTVDIERAGLTIRPHDKHRDYGEPNPVFTLEFSGLKYDDNEQSFGTITVTTTADETSPAGVYPITASGASNDNYRISYNDGVLTVTSSNTGVKNVTVSHTEYNAESGYYVADCGINSVDISVTTEEPNSIVICNGAQGNRFTVDVSRPDIYTVLYTVRSQDGTKTHDYTLRLEKRFEFDDIVVQKWNNVLLVNNNPDHNNGYSFTAFAWYRDGEPIGTGSYYSAGDKASDLLDENALYSVRLTTSDGKMLRTCESSPVIRQAGVLVYPNPVRSGQMVTVEVYLPSGPLENAGVEVSDSEGLRTHKEPLTGERTKITMPSEAGIYFITVRSGDFEKTVKIAVQ